VRFAGPAFVALAVLGLGACRSQPSAKAVAKDYIASIPDLKPEERQCMITKLDAYDDATLTSIGDANLDVDFDQPDAVESASPAFQHYVDDLKSCITASG
jgi:hypothetical protein